MSYQNILQNLRKRLDNEHSSDNDESLDLFRGLKFVCEYNKLEPTDDNCCFNHIIGLPQGAHNVLPSPIFQWQYDYIIKHLESKKYNWVLKSTGIGLSELALRWILYKSLVNDKWSDGIVPIFTGVNFDLASRLIDRAYTMMYQFFPNCKENARTIRINNVEITAFPGGHMDTARSLTNTRMFFLDEFDFFEEEKNKEGGRKIAERQIAKSNPDILIASTPNMPGGPMEQIQNEEPSLYNKIFLPYTIGIGTIYTKSQIMENMKSPSFEQEYNLKYLGGIGDMIPLASIEQAIEEYSLDEIITTSSYYRRWIGIDPGFKSSKFGICIVQWRDEKLEVVYTNSLSEPLYTDALKLVRQLIQRFQACKVFVDASASHIIHELKYGYGEYVTYEKLKPEQLDRYIGSECGEPLIVPVNFGKYHKNMAKHTVKALAHEKVRIHPKFEDLIISLKSAQTKIDQFTLDKNHSANNDLLDAFRMALLCLKPAGE
jgi:hypothetical protein